MSKHIANQRATMVFTPTAFAKMIMLIQGFETEVAWHGIAKRDENNPRKFIISDILVYPQYVSAGTVNTDQQPYEEWLKGLDDETFENLRMQGHSHVSFSTSPSTVDDNHRERLVEQLDADMFYIFLIWNKKFEHTNLIYDMTCNTIFEDKDITVSLGEEGVNLDEFIKSAKEIATRKVYTTPTYDNYGYGNSSVYVNVGTFAKTEEKPAATTYATASDKKQEAKKDDKAADKSDKKGKSDKKSDKESDIKTKPKNGSSDKPQVGSSQYSAKAPNNAVYSSYQGYGYAGYGNYGDDGYTNPWDYYN